MEWIKIQNNTIIFFLRNTKPCFNIDRNFCTLLTVFCTLILEVSLTLHSNLHSLPILPSYFEFSKQEIFYVNKLLGCKIFYPLIFEFVHQYICQDRV